MEPVDVPVQKKRGRKPKNQTATQTTLVVDPATSVLTIEGASAPEASVTTIQGTSAKKRGRKPKGGKVVANTVAKQEKESPKMNVILHLKCSLKDLHKDNQGSHMMEPYNSSDGNFDTLAENCPRDQQQLAGNYGAHTTNISSICHVTTDPEIACDTANNDTVHSNTKQLNDKLKQLEMQLHHNYANDSKSSCFWCTYKFDNPSIFIPKHYLKDTYHVYGCFCSPECSVAYLMNENLDSSTKFERYYLLNNVYGSIYNYTKSIKPAPDPHYTLDKFCGNLSIQEYRAMLGNDRLYIVVDKPLTRVMPELHQANEDHIINNKMIPSNQNMVRSSKRVLNKTDILAENFGMTTA